MRELKEIIRTAVSTKSEKDISNAFEHIHSLLEEKPNNLMLYKHSLDLYLKTGQLDKAENLIADVREKGHLKRWMIFFLEGVLADWKKDTESAFNALHKAIKIVGPNKNLVLTKTYISNAFSLKNYRNVLGAINQVDHENYAKLNLVNYQIDSLFNLAKYDRAINLHNKKEPTNKRAFRIGYKLVNIPKLTSTIYSNLYASLDHISGLHKWQVMWLKAYLHWRIFEHWKAYEMIEEAIQIAGDVANPRVAGLYFNILFRTNKLNQLKETFNRLDFDVGHTILRTVINSLLRMDELELAYDLIQENLSTNSKWISLFRLKRILEKSLGKEFQAIEDLPIEEFGPYDKFKAFLLDQRDEEAFQILEETKADYKNPEFIFNRIQLHKYRQDFNSIIDTLQQFPGLTENKPALTEIIKAYLYTEDMGNAMHYYNIYKQNFLSEFRQFDLLTFYFNATCGSFSGCFKEYPKRLIARSLDRLTPKRHNNIGDCKRCIILASGGPGDEIRFSSIYNELTRIYPEVEFIITVEPRLHSIFERSFPQIKFFPLKRFRAEYPFDTYKNREDVTSLDLANICNNDVLKLIDEDTLIFTNEEILANEFSWKEDFEDINDLLTPNQELLDIWKDKLKKFDGVKVGIAWRSGLLSTARNHHYLKLEEIIPFFEKHPSTHFFIVQYDLHDTEKDKLETYNNVHVLDDEINLKDDFEAQCALLSQLDYIISPFTTTGECSGAVGTPTLMFSNDPISNYRIVDGDKDIFRETTKIIRPTCFGDFEEILLKIDQELNQVLYAD